MAHLTPLRGAIVQDALQPSALTGRPPLGSFPPCSLSTSKRTSVGLRSFFRPPTLVHLLTATLTWGPTGTRPEYITDLLNVPRRIHANKIHAALSALFCRISAGTLPPAARWLTRTRLCWQRKKNGKPRPIKMGGVALPSVTPRVPLGFYAHPGAFMSSVVGTLPMFVTLSSSSAVTQAPPPWARPLAPVSKSTPGPGSQCALVTSCALSSTLWTTHPLNSS